MNTEKYLIAIRHNMIYQYLTELSIKLNESDNILNHFTLDISEANTYSYRDCKIIHSYIYINTTSKEFEKYKLHMINVKDTLLSRIKKLKEILNDKR